MAIRLFLASCLIRFAACFEDEDLFAESINTELLQVKIELSKNVLDTGRSTTEGSTGKSDDVEADSTCADHCKYVGSTLWQYDPDCQGCKASLLQVKDCMDYCKHEPSTVWQYDANCASCTALAQSSPSNSQSSDKERVGCADYCKYVGAAVQQFNPDCKDCTASFAQKSNSSIPSCSDYCQKEPSGLWPYDAKCQDCAVVSTAEAGTKESDQCEDHCKFVGAAVWQHDPECRGCKTSELLAWAPARIEEGECQDHCKYQGAAVWKDDAACSGCFHALLQEKLRNNGTKSECTTITGGTCMFHNCDYTRGPTQCNWARLCVCPENFCSQNGVCVFNLNTVMR